MQKSDDLSGNINTCFDAEILGAMLFKFELGDLFHFFLSLSEIFYSYGDVTKTPVKGCKFKPMVGAIEQ